MIEELRKYIDLLFMGTEDCDEVKEEILQNTIDRYEDLIRQGKSPQAAYRLAISGIGDINEILGTAVPSDQPKKEDAPKDHPPEKPVWKKILQALGIFLYIVCPVPLFVLQNELGLCGLLGVVAIATALMIISSGKNFSSSHSGQTNETGNSLGNLIGVIVLAAYLLLSFATGAWYITWILFPIAGSIKGIITALTDKKDNVLLRVILYAMATLILLGILGVGLGIGTLTAILDDFNLVDIFDHFDGSYVTGNASFDSSEVRNIYVEWASGSITVLTDQVDKSSITEERPTSEKYEMAYHLVNGTLTVMYSPPNSLFGFKDIGNKHLTITVPENWVCYELQMDVASADIKISNLSGTSVELNSASGRATFENCTFRNLDVDTASGDIHYKGTIESVSCSAASANLNLILANTPKNIAMDCASGNANITLPTDTGFVIRMDSLSGRYYSEFPATISGSDYIYGDGRCEIEMDSLSGDIKIYTAK